MIPKGAWLLLSLQGTDWEICQECQMPYIWDDVHWARGYFLCGWHMRRAG